MWKSRIVSEGTEAQDQLLANPCNPRIHPQTQQKALQASLANIGWVQRILVNKNTGHVVDGHARIELAISNGETEVPVTYLDLTEQEEKLILATYDPISAMAVNDQDMLNDLIKDIDTDSAALQELLDDLATEAPVVGQTDEDSVPEVKEDPKSERGKIYLLGRHRVMCGDSTSAECVEQLMDGQNADLWITDPPYNVNYEGGTGLKIENDSMDDKSFRSFLVSAFGCAFSVMKPGASFYIWHADLEGYNFRGAVKDCEEDVRSCLVWNKQSLVLGRGDYQWKHEPCLYGWKKGASHGWYSERKQTTVLDFDRPSRSSDHPTMKPVDLFQYQIGNSTAPHGAVLDTFLGSGTTIIACEKLGRTCYGMEIDPHYVDVIRERWAEFVHGEGCDWEELTPAEQPNG